MQPGARFRLIVRRGPQPNQQYELAREKLTIGRDITNDIAINDPEVSRHHARLVRTASGYAIEDLRSTNGTFVNNQRITTLVQLTHGDLIGMGETVTLAYEATGMVDAATVVGGGPQYTPAPQPMQQPYPPPGQPYPPPGYGQPYGAYPPVEEEDEPDRNRWLIIGCAVLTLVFCCAVVAAFVIIDSQNLYCDIPIMRSMSLFCVQ